MREQYGDGSAQKYGGGYEQGAPTEGTADSNTLTIRVRRAGSAARHASPSSAPNFAYAALLYPDGETSNDFVAGEIDPGSSEVIFLFEKPADTTSLVLELFAFAENTTAFSKTDALLGGKCGVTLRDGEKTITLNEDAIPLKAVAGKEGFVSLKVTAPADCTLDIDDNAKSYFTLGGTPPDHTLAHKGDGILASSYPIQFIVTTKSGTAFRVPETVNVYPGMTTDAWYGGEVDAPLEIPALADKFFYVRGSGAGWYSAHDELKNIEASDSNAGTYLSPLKTIQRAIDTVIAANDGASEYTVCIDGDLTLASTEQAGANGMSDFSALDKPLKLTIRPLSADAKSTLDANTLSRVMYASPASGGSLTLILERLILTGGKVNGDGGGIDIRGASVSLTDCDIMGNTATNAGGVYILNGASVTMSGGTISGNTGGDNGGICVNAGCSFEMSDGEISNNIGSGALVLGTLKLDGVEVKGNSGTGISLFDDAGCEFKMKDGVTVSGNKGGGIYVGTGDTLTMPGGTISDNSTSYGGGVYVKGTFTMGGGAISGNTATSSGGGIYIYGGMFSAVNSTIADCSAKYGGGVYIETSETAYMNSVTVSGCSAEKGSGAYVAADKMLGLYNPLFEDGTNDVYLENGAYVYRGIDNSSGSNLIMITPAVYASGKKVANLNSHNYHSTFRVTPEDDGTKWAVNLDGTLMHGVFSALTEDEIKAGEVDFMSYINISVGGSIISTFIEYALVFVTSEGVYGVLQCQENGGALAAECRLFPGGVVNTFTINIGDYVDLDTGTASSNSYSVSSYDLRLKDDHCMGYYNGAKGTFLKLAD